MDDPEPRFSHDAEPGGARARYQRLLVPLYVLQTAGLTVDFRRSHEDDGGQECKGRSAKPEDRGRETISQNVAELGVEGGGDGFTLHYSVRCG